MQINELKLVNIVTAEIRKNFRPSCFEVRSSKLGLFHKKYSRLVDEKSKNAAIDLFVCENVMYRHSALYES